MNVAIVTRLAVLFALLFMGGALLSTFVPAEYRNGPCGTWWDPEWKQPEADQLAEDMAFFSPARAVNIADRIEGCDNALDNRRVLSIALGGVAILIPVVAIIVTPSNRSRQD